MGTLNTERERDRETLREEGRDRQGERNLVEGIGQGTRLDSRDGDLDFEYREGERQRVLGGWGVGGQSVDDERSFRQVSRSGVEDLAQVRGVGLARGG